MTKGSGGGARGAAHVDRWFQSAAAGAARVIDAHADHSAVTDFLNVNRKVASDLQQHGFAAVAEKYGADRAKQALATIQGTNRALKSAAASQAPSVVYRGQTQGQAAAGSKIANRNIWSSTPDRANALNFASKAGKDAVLYEIHTRSAVPTDNISGSNTYRETLIPSGTKFRKARERWLNHNGKRVKLVVLHEEA